MPEKFYPFRMLKNLPLMIVICVSGTLQNAHADSIVITGASWHASDHGGSDNIGDTYFNEINPGLGFEHPLNENNTFSLGFYNNSFSRHTDYILDFWQPLQWAPSIGKIKFGLAVGIASGYQGDSFIPVAVPMLTYENENWGLNFVTITFPMPELAKRSVLAVQLKINIP